MPSLKEIFNIISARKDLLEPSNALGLYNLLFKKKIAEYFS